MRGSPVYGFKDDPRTLLACQELQHTGAKDDSECMEAETPKTLAKLKVTETEKRKSRSLNI